MKIAHINATYGQEGTSGTEQSVPNTCRHLQARGHETCVLYGTATGSPDPAAGAAFLIPGLCDLTVRPRLQTINAALDVLRDEAVDVVHLHQTNNPHLVGAIAERWPTLYFVHNHILTCPSGQRVFMNGWHLCHQRGPAVTCVSNAYLRHCNSRRPGRVAYTMASTLRARSFAKRLQLAVDSKYMKGTLVDSGFAADRIAVTPTVTEVTEMPVTALARDPRHILYVGQLNEIKGAPLLVSAMAELPPDVTLSLAGDGYARAAIEDQVARQGLTARVRLAGRLSRADLDQLYAQCALVAVPVRYPEPFGLVGPEAMAHATAVVAFGHGGIPEWLEHEQTGLIAEPENLTLFMKHLRRLLDDPAEAARMGAEGRRVWETRFHPRHHIDDLLAIYGSLVDAA